MRVHNKLSMYTEESTLLAYISVEEHNIILYIDDITQELKGVATQQNSEANKDDDQSI